MPFRVLDDCGVKTTFSVYEVEAVILHTDPSPICRGWPGAIPSGIVPSDHGAREQNATSEHAISTAVQGNILQVALLLPCTLLADSRLCVLVSFTDYGPHGTSQTFVVVFHLAGGVACVRDRPGGREGESRPGTLFKASSDAQVEEGRYRLNEAE